MLDYGDFRKRSSSVNRAFSRWLIAMRIKAFFHVEAENEEKSDKWKSANAIEGGQRLCKILIYQTRLSMQRKGCSCHSDEFSINQRRCLDRNEKLFRGINKFPRCRKKREMKQFFILLQLESNNKFRLINLHLECACFSPPILNQNLNFLRCEFMRGGKIFSS